MNSSTIIDTYIGVSIRTISPGSIIVDLYLYYNLTTNNTAIDLYTVIANNGEDFMDYGIQFSADNLTVQGRSLLLLVFMDAVDMYIIITDTGDL